MQLADLKQFNPDVGTLESLVEMYATGRILQREFDELEESLGVESPTWLDGKLKRIKREIVSKQADRNAKRLAEVRLQLEQFKTPGQKKKELEAEARRLEALSAEAGE